MEAKTLRQNEKGEILLDGGDNGIVELNGTLDASGMEAGQSAGSIKAIGAETHVEDGAKLHAIGAVDGGLIETSGDYLEIGDNVDIDAAGKTGKAGEWLLDPTEVIISDTETGTVHGGSNAYKSGTTYLKTSTIADILKNNNVTIQATDPTYHNADITLASALNVDETTADKNTLTLEAEENININADIHATAALNVVLNADTNRDDKGGVNINADIRTGGGSLTTGANGATFFGGTNSGENYRVIETSGGDVNIQNEARLQLNGGTLSINTAGGNVNFARNVASMNKYEAFMDHDFVEYYSQDYPTGELSAEGQAWENMIKSVYGKSYIDANGRKVKFVIQGRDYYWGVYDKAYKDLTNSEKLRLSNMLARIWELANLAATQNNSKSDPDGKNLDGQHLVTITDKYENSAAMASARKISGSVIEYFTGGKETTTNPSASKVSGREFSWVTGPEKDQVFYITGGIGSGADQNGMYTNWVRNVPTGIPELPYYNEPNNNGGRTSQPYVAIGWTDQNGWDDVGNNATTIHGFIRETELPNSALSISGAGKVTVGTEGVADTGRLGSGEGTGLRNLSIETTGDVKVLGSIYVHDNHANAAEDLANGNVEIATQGNVDVGQITADKKVEIATTGADRDVTVNGKIATDGLVSIKATDDITVHGIENGDTIRLISTNPNGDGAITLANNAEGGGALITQSKANDAVIIDVQGKNGSFQNLTTAEKAIDTDGKWKVYSASPDRDEFGTNLDSKTTARWHASSQGRNGLDKYFETENTNKYIFQTQPTLTITAENKEKTYGETVELTAQKKAEFIGKDGNPHDVTGYTNAFREVSEGGSIMDRYDGKYILSSDGQAASATRTQGKYQADSDKEFAVYDIEVKNDAKNPLRGLEGYGIADLTNKGKLEIKRRTVVLNGSASQTYGDATLRDTNVYAETGTDGQGVTNGDELDTSGVEYTISPSGKYAASKNAHVNGVTADAGTYNDELLFSKVHFTNNADANYAFTGNGNITVDKHTITRNELGLEGSPLFETFYGTKPDDLGKATFNGVNGDGSYELNITGTNALTGKDTGRVTNDVGSDYYTTVALSDALSKNYKFDNGKTSKDFEKTASVTPVKLTIESKGFNATYGEVEAVQQGLKNAVTITGLTNGDGAAKMIVDGTSDALITDENGKTRTNDVKQNGNAGYDINASIPDNLTDTINKNNKNYEITNNLGKVVLQKRKAYLSTDDIHTVYGDGDTIYNKLAKNNLLHLTNLASWDTESDILKQIKAGTTVKGNVSAFKLNADGTIATDAEGHRYTNNVRAYSITTSWYRTLAKNYTVEKVANKNGSSGNIYVDPADLIVYRKGIDTVYGTVRLAPSDMTTYTKLVNGDKNDIVIDNGNYGKAYSDDLKTTNNVGKYKYKATLNSASDVLRNYNVHDDGMNYVNITPYTLTEENIVNPDGKPLYTTKYGRKDPFGKVTFTGVNGDGTLLLDITDSSALTGAADGRITKDVGDNIYDTTVSLEKLQNKNYQFAGGAMRKTFEKTASVTPARLTITTENVETKYGTVETTTSEVDGLTNGDLPTGFIYDYGNYGGAYLDGNTKTNDVNTYHFGTKLSGAEFLKNYTITGGEADVKIDPKDVTFFVSGTGNTLADVTYTVDPDIDAQLAYGEHVDADYTPGNTVGDNQYGVVANINGTPIISGNVAGNYRYNYEGLITLSPTVPTKPDIDPHNPSNLDGSGSWTSNMGNHGVPGVERVAGLASAELPFFKVEAGQVSHYGTYDVAADPDKVRLEPTGKRLPEPNQPKTQYREYTKALTTTDGTGMFRMVYDGSTFNITPVDDGALALMRMGDVKNNVELSAEALHAGFSEMGILLEDLDGVYVHFDTMA